MRRLLITLFIASMLAASTIEANAMEDLNTQQARVYYEEGTKNYRVGEYRQALDAFKAGYFTRRDAVFLFNMAQCYRMLGEHENAVREYRAYLNEKPAATNREDVEKLIAEEEERIRRPATRGSVEEARSSGVAATAATPQFAIPVASRPPNVPLYKRWWLWTAVAGGIVIVGGVAAATGIALTTPNEPSVLASLR